MENYDLSKLSVLIVEKHASLRAMIMAIFREFGVELISGADSPETGYEVFNKMNPDIVLVDWAPDFDGIGLLNRIRTDKDSPNPYVPVIIVTAHSEKDRVIEARDFGMTEFLAKPISAKMLYERIAIMVESERPFVKDSKYFGPDRRRRERDFEGDNRRGETQGADDQENNVEPEEGAEGE